MGKEFSILNGVGVFLEHVDEQLADGFTLGFGIGNPLKLAKEQIRFVSVDQIEVIVVAEHAHDLFGLVFAQQAVVHKHTGQVFTDRFVDKDRRDRAVNAARQGADDFLVANLFTDRLDHLFAIGTHGPVAIETSQFDEVFIELVTARGVVNFGVELNRIEVAFGICRDCERRIWRGAVNLKSWCDFRHMVAVAHPDLFVAIGKPTVQQPQLALRRDKGATKFGGAVAAFDFPAQLLHHDLLAIADAKDRHAQVKDFLRRTWRPFAGDAVRPARENHGLGRKVAHKFHRDILIRVDFAIDAEFAQATRNELRDLATKVDDQKAVIEGVCHVRGIGPTGIFRKWHIARKMSLSIPRRRNLRRHDNSKPCIHRLIKFWRIPNVG